MIMGSIDPTLPVTINTAGGNTSKSTAVEGFRPTSIQNINTPSTSADNSAFDMQSFDQSVEETNPFRQLQAHRTGQSSESQSQSYSVASGILCFSNFLVIQ